MSTTVFRSEKRGKGNYFSLLRCYTLRKACNMIFKGTSSFAVAIKRGKRLILIAILNV